MESITAKEMARRMDGILLAGPEVNQATDVCIDSREAKAGDFFLAIPGERTNGHQYLRAAYDRGTRIAVIQQKEAAKDLPEDYSLILVEDTVRALQELAKEAVRGKKIRFIGITGSVGKTTTRDMVRAILARRYRVSANKANFNSLIGVPVTLLRLPAHTEIGVVEMGMAEAGDIAQLADIVPPDAAIITNIGISHMEMLGSRENIFKEKMNIAKNFTEKNVLVINADDDFLPQIDPGTVPYRIIKAGLAEDADFRAVHVEDLGDKGIRFRLRTPEGELPIRLDVAGAHNAVNACLAAACCSVFGVPPEDVAAGLGQLEMTGNRLRIFSAGSVRIIDDTYNAAPASMKSALTTLSRSEGKRRVAVLGDMNELGSVSREEHAGVGAFAADCGINLVLTVGEKGKDIARGAAEKGLTVQSFDRKEDLYPQLKDLLCPGDTVLIKASRSLELEKISQKIKELFEGAGAKKEKTCR